MKKFLLVLLFVCALTLPVWAMKNSPEGFRGIRWGMLPDEVEGLDMVGQDEDVLYFVRDSDQFSMGDAVLRGIQYLFHRERGFFQATLWARRQDNYIDMLVALKVRFGTPDYDHESEATSWWVDERALVFLGANREENYETTCVIVDVNAVRSDDFYGELVENYRGYTIKNSPEGLRGIRWEDRPGDVRNLTWLHETDKYGFYVRDDEDLSFGDGFLERIEYIFDKKYGFLQGILYARGHDNYGKVRGALIERFGEPRGSSGPVLYWIDNEVTIFLEFNALSEGDILHDGLEVLSGDVASGDVGSDEGKVVCIMRSNVVFDKRYYEDNREYMDRLNEDF